MRVGHVQLICDGYLVNPVAQLEFKLRNAQRMQLGTEVYALLWMRIAGGMPDGFPAGEYIRELFSSARRIQSDRQPVLLPG